MGCGGLDDPEQRALEGGISRRLKSLSLGSAILKLCPRANPKLHVPQFPYLSSGRNMCIAKIHTAHSTGPPQWSLTVSIVAVRLWSSLAESQH